MGAQYSIPRPLPPLAAALTCISVLFPTTPTTAADLRFRRIGIEDGFTQPAVLCVHQDPTGFIWIGTGDGLVRHDGHEFLEFRPDSPGITGNDGTFLVKTIHQDRDGFLWLGGTYGIYKFDPQSLRFVENHRHDPEDPESLRSRNILHITGTGDGRLWLGTDWGGLHRFDPATRELEHFPLRQPTPQSTNMGVVFSVVPDPKNPASVWLGTAWMGLVHLDAETNEIRQFSEDPPSTHPVLPPSSVTSINADQTGSLWISGGRNNGGLFRVDKATGTFQQRFEFRDDSSVTGTASPTRVLVDRDGDIWVGLYNAGIACFDPTTGVFTTSRHDASNPSSLSHNRINTLFQDRGGMIWTGSRFGGLCIFDPQGDWYYQHDLGEPTNPLSPSVMTRDETDPDLVWMGSGDGLVKWHRQTGALEHFRHDPDDPTSLSNNVIGRMARRNAGGFWIGTKVGLNFYDPASGRATRFTAPTSQAEPLTSHWIRALDEGPNGMLWAGRQRGVVRFDPNTGTLHHLRHDPGDPTSIGGGWVTSLHGDRSGNLWCALHVNGLSMLPAGSDAFVHFEPEQLLGARTYSLHEDAGADVLWVGTSLGLNRIDIATGQVTQFTVPSLARGIFGIAQEDAGPLWLRTPVGLVRMLDRHSQNPQFQQATGAVDVPFGMFVPAQLKLPDGNLLFGSPTGIIEVDPTRFKPSAPPEVVVTSLQLPHLHHTETGQNFTVPIAGATPSQPVLLTHAQNQLIQFKFAALDFAAPSRNRYAYRLDGLEERWQTGNSDHIATYTTLAPGDYVFRVKAANSQGIWNEQGASLPLCVLPPWWATWWFRGLAAFSVAALCAAYIRIRIRHTLERNAALESEITKRTAAEQQLQNLASRLIHTQEHERRHVARELHDDLTQRLAAMAMDTKLAESEIESAPERAHLELQEIQTELNEMATATQELSRQLHPKIIEELGLAKAVRAECRRFSKRSGTAMNAEIDEIDGLENDEKLCLYRILQEALGNIGKHAQADAVQVTLAQDPDGVSLSIKDDGTGFDTSALEANGSLGMVSMSERARLCHGTFKIESQPGAGTSVAVSLPGKNNHA